jgi:hypothetical protein
LVVEIECTTQEDEMKAKIVSRFAYAMLGLAAMAAAPAHAQVDTHLWDLASNGLENWTYVNLASSAGSGRNFSTWTDPNGHAGVKYFTLDLGNSGNTTPTCLEVSTGAVTGTISNTDTRIYYQNGASSFTSASDDINGATNRLSRVRLWVPDGNFPQLRIGGYDASYNSIDFRVIVKKLANKSTSAQCEDIGMAFLVYPNSVGWPTAYRTN